MATQKRASSSRQGAAKKGAGRKAAVKKSAAEKAAVKKAAAGKAAAPATGTARTRAASAAAPASKGPRLDPVGEQFGPRLRAELEEVARSEAKILRSLKNEQISSQFLADPASALNRMGVKLPPILRKRLKDRPPLTDLVAPKSFRLPNGQIVTATVNVRFTARKER
jgi:hypothetical protein